MISLHPGQSVYWQTNQPRPVRLTGTVAAVRSNTAIVAVNGSTYEVEQARLQVVPLCINCGKVITGRRDNRRRWRYCGVECRYEDLHKDFDNYVLQTIVDFKAAHDGWSPAIPVIRERTGLADMTIRRTLRRLAEAGRIRVVKNGPATAYIVRGGRWVYEGG